MALIGKVNDVKHARGEVRFANDLEASGMGAVSFMERVALDLQVKQALNALLRQRPFMVDFASFNSDGAFEAKYPRF